MNLKHMSVYLKGVAKKTVGFLFGCNLCILVVFFPPLQVSKDVPAETLLSFVANIMKKTPGKTLALVVVGLENYFRLKLLSTALFLNGFF